MAEGKEQVKHSKWYHRACGFGIGALVMAGVFVAKTDVSAPGLDPLGNVVRQAADRAGRLWDDAPTTTTTVVQP